VFYASRLNLKREISEAIMCWGTREMHAEFFWETPWGSCDLYDRGAGKINMYLWKKLSEDGN